MTIQGKPYNLHQEKESLDSFLSTITDSSSALQDEQKTDFATKIASEHEDYKPASTEPEKEKAETVPAVTVSPAIHALSEAEQKQDAVVLPVEDKSTPDYIAPEEPLPLARETAPLQLEKDITAPAPPEKMKTVPESIPADVPKTEELPLPEAEKKTESIYSKDDDYKPEPGTKEISGLKTGAGTDSDTALQDVPEVVAASPVIAHEEKPKEQPDFRAEERDQQLHRAVPEEIRISGEVIPEAERTARIEPAVEAREKQKPAEGGLPLPEKEESIKEAAARPAKKERKPFHWGALVRAGILFVVFVAIIQGYLWMNPETGQQSVQWLAQNVPGMDKVLNEGQVKRDSVTESVKFTDVRQRNISNIFLGNLRIVEGTAVNSAAYPIARIRIIGELYNNKNIVISTRVAFGGNVVSDERLASLNEEEIKSALSIPQGSDMSNNRIPPGGKIPFMLVFVGEPAGVVKTTIMPLSAEKLAP